MNGFERVRDMVYLYANGVKTLHGYLLQGETLEDYMVKHNTFADILREVA